MSTIVIEVDDKSSVKLFLQLARKLQYKVKVLSSEQKEDCGLLSMIEERRDEPALPIESTLEILSILKTK